MNRDWQENQGQQRTAPARWPHHSLHAERFALGSGILLLLGAWLLLPGCAYEVYSVNDPWGSLRQFADRPVSEVNPDDPGAQGYTMLLQTFDGRDRNRKASELIESLSRHANVPDLWVRDSGAMTSVFRGRYTSPDSVPARTDLEQMQRVTINGKQPYANVEFTPLAPANTATGSPLDLHQFPGMYTLQVAYYDDKMGPNFRETAEDFTRALRSQGEEAYFYHGPNRSLVTVGLFNEDDFVREGDTQAYGPRMRELQVKHPIHQRNGKNIMEPPQHGQEAQPQQSCIVQVPFQ
jgi:hypothetical protein